MTASGTRFMSFKRIALCLAVAGLSSILQFGALVPEARAQVFKCKDANGRTHYSDSRCEGRQEPYRPRALTDIPSERLTGGRKAAGGERKSGWVSPLDPVANCEKQGGKFSREYRGCLLP